MTPKPPTPLRPTGQALTDAATELLDRRWRARTLAEVDPYYGGRHFADGRWPSMTMHSE